MSITTYAQNFEDVILWRTLHDVGVGVYVDVGANDPDLYSISKLFHIIGWHGVHVEPVEHYAQLLRQKRGGDVVIQAALGREAGQLSFFNLPGTGMSTAVAEIADTHSRNGWETQAITVPCMRLDDVLDQIEAPDIHWLKIDVEGLEEDVLAGWTNQRRPWIVLVEATRPLTQIPVYEQWENLLLDKGYVFVYFDGLNRFYLSPDHLELKERFSAAGPNLFDGFQINDSHWAGQALTATLQAQWAHERGELCANHQAAEARWADERGELCANHQAAEARQMAEQANWRRQAEFMTLALDQFRQSFWWRITLPLRALTTATSSPVHLRSIAAADPWVAVSVTDLLTRSDPDFVTSLYATLLGRHPDPAGHADIMAKLQAGKSRTLLLAQTALSPEGRRHRADHLPGLDVIVYRYRWRRVPLIGWIFRSLGVGE